MRIASSPTTALLLSTLSLVACDAGYHLVGNLDDAGIPDLGSGGSSGGQGGSGGQRPWNDAAAGGAGAGGFPAAGGSFGSGGSSGPPAPVPLTLSPREALNRVARVLWESPPDSALVSMADAGLITTDADLRRVAAGMLTDPRARLGVGHFYRWWLDLDRMASVAKDPAVAPEYSPALGQAMASETETFGSYVTVAGDGQFSTLMRAAYSFINADLAALYGVGGVTGSELRKVDLDPTYRSGLLTQLAFLTQTASANLWTSPTHRGIYVEKKFLCSTPPAPPPNVDIAVPPEAIQTGRQRLTNNTSQAACTACHALFDPMGFAFERFDTVGRVRSTDNGLPIDTSGTLVSVAGGGSFADAIQLIALLEAAPEVHRCMGTQWLTYALGRTLVNADQPSVTAIQQLFEGSGLDLRTGLAAALSSSSFLAPNGGPPCVFGTDQSCNDDPRVSSLHGTCTGGGKCVCGNGYQLNPATGRCL